MKNSNYTTPRTLADCSFYVGHPETQKAWAGRIEDALGWIICLSLFAGIGVLLAWRG